MKPRYKYPNPIYTKFSQAEDWCRAGKTTSAWKFDDRYSGFVICISDEFDHMWLMKNWHPPGGNKYYIIRNNNRWTGIQFDKSTFRPLIENSKTVFINEKERNNFLQEVERCNYIWDDCIEYYCNKRQWCSYFR